MVKIYSKNRHEPNFKELHSTMCKIVGLCTFVVVLSWKFTISWPDFQKKTIQALVCLSYSFESKGAGKTWPWCVEQWVKLASQKGWDWSSHFWSFRVVTMLWRFLLLQKMMRSAPDSRINKLNAPFDAPGSRYSSALRINILLQTHERMKYLLWNSRLRTITNCDGEHGTTLVQGARRVKKIENANPLKLRTCRYM